jgi:hypothetical protein
MAGTTPTAAAPATGSADQSADNPLSAGGGIARLDAFDGLFLRAEHLATIQDYARDLALAVGAAGGPGVVEGFEIGLDVPKLSLTIGPGLAIAPNGRPLRSRRDITVPIGDGLPSIDVDGFWWIELTPLPWGYGHDTVNGTLCDEPCSGTTTHTLYLAEGVQIRLAPDTCPGLNSRAQLRRSVLAQRLFAAEQAGAGYWPDPAAPSADRVWTPPPAAVGGPGDSIRLGVLLPGAAPLHPAPELDTWLARRDRDAAPPQQLWQWRLGMRPWNVFTAQILQFQALLSTLPAGSGPDRIRSLVQQMQQAGPGASNEELGRIARQLVGDLPADDAAQPAHDGAEEAADDAAADAAAGAAAGAEGPSLAGLGLVDLPPAGYLPVTAGLRTGEIRDHVAALLGERVDIRLVTCRQVDLAQAIREARHRDRIPLPPPAEQKVDVDVLVPGDGAGWVVFARRDGRAVEVAEPPTDVVDVHILDDTGGDGKAFGEDLEALFEKHQIPQRDGAPHAPDFQLRYPAGGWAEPKDDDSYAEATARVAEIVGRVGKSFEQLSVVAVCPAAMNVPLGVARAALLTWPYSTARGVGSDVPIRPPSACTAADGKTSAIVVLIGKPAERDDEVQDGEHQDGEHQDGEHQNGEHQDDQHQEGDQS